MGTEGLTGLKGVCSNERTGAHRRNEGRPRAGRHSFGDPEASSFANPA